MRKYCPLLLRGNLTVISVDDEDLNKFKDKNGFELEKMGMKSRRCGVPESIFSDFGDFSLSSSLFYDCCHRDPSQDGCSPLVLVDLSIPLSYVTFPPFLGKKKLLKKQEIRHEYRVYPRVPERRRMKTRTIIGSLYASPVILLQRRAIV